MRSTGLHIQLDWRHQLTPAGSAASVDSSWIGGIRADRSDRCTETLLVLSKGARMLSLSHGRLSSLHTARTTHTSQSPPLLLAYISASVVTQTGPHQSCASERIPRPMLARGKSGLQSSLHAPRNTHTSPGV